MKTIITNGTVNVEIDSKSTRQIYAELVNFGAKISLSSIKELVAKRKTNVLGFALQTVAPEPETVKKASKPRLNRRFEIAEACDINKRKGRYQTFLKLIASGTDTIDGLVDEIGQEHKYWVQNAVCCAKGAGHIVQIDL